MHWPLNFKFKNKNCNWRFWLGINVVFVPQIVDKNLFSVYNALQNKTASHIFPSLELLINMICKTKYLLWHMWWHKVSWHKRFHLHEVIISFFGKDYITFKHVPLQIFSITYRCIRHFKDAVIKIIWPTKFQIGNTLLLITHCLCVFMHVLSQFFRMSLALPATILTIVDSVGKRHNEIINWGNMVCCKQ